VFLINSSPGLLLLPTFKTTSHDWRAFSLSYSTILPSSFDVILSFTLEFNSPPTCVRFSTMCATRFLPDQLTCHFRRTFLDSWTCAQTRRSQLSSLLRDCVTPRGRTFRGKPKTFGDQVYQPNLRYSSQHIQLCYSVLSFSTDAVFTLSTATARMRSHSDTPCRLNSHLLEFICRDENIHAVTVDCMISTNAA